MFNKHISHSALFSNLFYVFPFLNKREWASVLIYYSFVIVPEKF